MSLDYWYDDGYGYGYSDISVDGLFGGLFDGLGSLFGDLFYDDYYYGYDYGYGYDYDYGYGWDDDEVITVDSNSYSDDYSLFDSVFGLFDGLLSYDDTLSVDGSSGLLGLFGGLESVLGGLFSDDYYYDYGYDYGYDYDYDYEAGDGEAISVDSTGALSDLGDLSGLESILGLLGGSGLSLSTDESTSATSGIDLSSILSLLGGSGLSLGTDDGTATSASGIDLSSILGLLGGSGTSVSVEGSTASAASGIDLSSILSLLGGSGTSLSTDALSGLGSALSGLASIYSGISDLGTTSDSASWDDLDFLDNLNNVLPNVSGGTTDTSSLLSSILGLLGGSGTSVSVDGSTASSGLDLSSILNQLGSGTSVSVDGSTASATTSGIDLSSILALLSGSGTTLSTDALSGLGSTLSGLASLYSGITNLGSDGESATWDDLDFLDNLNNILPNVSGGTTDTSSLLTSILGLLGGAGTSVSVDGSTASAPTSGLDLSSILGLLGGSDSSLSVDGLDLSSILGLLGGSGLDLGTDGSSFDLASIQDFLNKLMNGIGLDISLTTGDGDSMFQFEGLLSHFITTVTADVGSLIPGDLFAAAPEMTVQGIMQTAMDLVSDLGSTAETFLQEALTLTTPLLSWGDENAAAAQGYWVEIASGTTFDDAIRVFTTGTAFDVDGSAGLFSCRAALQGSEFITDAVEWIAEVLAPRQIVSNANGLADIFFASAADSDVWSVFYRASNDLTGETASIAGKNRIRDTFSGSTSDANILYLTDTANGDALFMDDIYSEFGAAARLDLIREIRSGAGDDVIDMTSKRYSADLAGMTVRGGSGDDVLWGANGGNILFGDDGNDRISGGSGSDIIAGGSGDDVLNGGGGSDLFAFGENWGNDVVSQFAGGSIELWFIEDESQITAAELDGSVIFRNAAGTSSVTVENATLADLNVHFGDDQSVCFSGLVAAGAFLDSTAESVFESQEARTQGVLASL